MLRNTASPVPSDVGLEVVGASQEAKVVLVMKPSTAATIRNSRDLGACRGRCGTSSAPILWQLCLLLKLLGVQEASAHSSSPLHCMNMSRLVEVRLREIYSEQILKLLYVSVCVCVCVCEGSHLLLYFSRI